MMSNYNPRYMSAFLGMGAMEQKPVKQSFSEFKENFWTVYKVWVLIFLSQANVQRKPLHGRYTIE